MLKRIGLMIMLISQPLAAGLSATYPKAAIYAPALVSGALFPPALGVINTAFGFGAGCLGAFVVLACYKNGIVDHPEFVARLPMSVAYTLFVLGYVGSHTIKRVAQTTWKKIRGEATFANKNEEGSHES